MVWIRPLLSDDLHTTAFGNGVKIWEPEVQNDV
jgi:hypothetical protein